MAARLQHGAGAAAFFTSHRGHAYASTALNPMTKTFVADIHHFIDARGLDLVNFGRERKNDVTLRYLANFTGTEGVLYVGRAQEKASVWRTQRRRNADGSSYAWLGPARWETLSSPDVREFFPDAAHMASWCGLFPGNHESAGRPAPAGAATATPTCSPCWWNAPGPRSATTATSSPCTAGTYVMGNCGYRSRDKAIITVAHAILVIIWHVLATGKPYHELGADYFDRRTDLERETRRLIARLEALGHAVTLQAAA